MSYLLKLNPIVLALIFTMFTYAITAIGASLVFFFNNVNQKILDLMMGLAGGIMIAASIWSLLLPSIELCKNDSNHPYIVPAIGFFIGGLFIIGCDVFLNMTLKVSEERKRNILLASAVTMHNIPEGMSIRVAFGSLSVLTSSTIVGPILLSIGIGLQNFPEGICVSMPLRRDKVTPKKAFLVGQASGLVEPLAGVLGAVFAITIKGLLPLFLSFSAGSMIAVVCSELIPAALRTNKTIAS